MTIPFKIYPYYTNFVNSNKNVAKWGPDFMLFGVFEQDKQAVLHQYDSPKWTEQSGLSVETLRQRCSEIEAHMAGFSRLQIKTEMFVYILKNSRIAVDSWNWFASHFNHGFILREFYFKWLEELNHNEMADCVQENRQAEAAMLYTADVDFGHTSPDWDYLLKVGFPVL